MTSRRSRSVHAGHGHQGTARRCPSRKGNVVSPDDMIARYGADATRACIRCLPHRPTVISTGRRMASPASAVFLASVYRLVMKHADAAKSLRTEQTIRSATLKASPATELYCASCIRPFPRSRRTSLAAGTSTPASRPSWNWSTNPGRGPMLRCQMAKCRLLS